MESNNKISVVVVAAGSGRRYGGNLPKQFLPLDNKIILCRTIDAFREALPGANILLVLSSNDLDFWKKLCSDNNYISPQIVVGGDTRGASVRNALSTIDSNQTEYILIHDGARPLVNKELILRVVDRLRKGAKAVVPVLDLTDSIMERFGTALLPRNRSDYKLVQTPQGFNSFIIKFAYANFIGNLTATDDATMAAKIPNLDVIGVEGDKHNIKITHPGDIKLAEFYLECSH